MKANLLCLLALLLLLGCQKNGPGLEKHCYPQTMEDNGPKWSNRTAERFVYNEKMQVIGLEDGLNGFLQFRFFYSDNGNLKYSEQMGYEQRVEETVLYTYDDQNRLVRADFFRGVPSEKGPYVYLVFSYNSDNTVIKRERYAHMKDGKYDPYATHTYTYLSKQQLKINYEVISYGTLIDGELHIIFDNKKSHYASTPGYRTMTMAYDSIWLFPNNIISFTNSHEQKLTEPSSYTSTFEYTSDGYAKTEHRTYSKGSLTRTHDYTFSCR